MPLITAVEPVRGRKGRLSIHVDGEFLCTLPEELGHLFELRVGEPLDTERLQEVLRESERSEAMDAAIRYLSYRPRTRLELTRHLRTRGHAAWVDHVMSRCDELGYVDDRRYAAAFARERIRLRPRGLPRIVSELLAKGIERHTAELAAREALEEEGFDEADLLRRAAERRAPAVRHLDPDAARNRLASYLLRRGFKSSAVWPVVQELVKDVDPDSRTG
jgi:regulatory protein